MDKENSQNVIKTIESIFDFDQNSPSTFVEKVSAFEETSNQLLNISQSQIKTIEEKEYIDQIFRVMIDEGMAAFKVLTKTVKVGISGKDMEGYSRFFDSLSMTLERLINYKMKIREIEMMMNPEVNTIKKEDAPNLFMTGKELNNFINEAKKNSQLNGIDATFEVLDGEFSEKKKE